MNKTLYFIALFFGTPLLLAEPLERFLADPALKTASVGFAMIPLEEPKTEAATKVTEDDEATEESEAKEPTPSLLHNPDLALTPASVQKAITTATALQILGPDYKFQTRLYRDGDNLIIKGGGDPLLASTSLNVEFPTWHKALLAADLSEITGTLIADPSRFEDRSTPNQWLWGDIGNYYGAGPCGLNFHKNSYQITFKPGNSGSPARLVSTYPKPPGVTFENHMRTGSSSSGDQGYAYVGPRRKLITLRGSVPAGGNFTIKGALPDPPLSCLTAFQSYLKKNDFSVAKIKVQRGTTTKEEHLLHTTKSPALSKLIISTNQKSINLNAECLFKALTPQGTTLAAQKKLVSHWKEQGVNLNGFIAHDGSGLSPQNTLTARQTAHILKLVAHSEHAPIFRTSLPVAGRSGTMRYFGSGTSAEGRVIAKSGSMERVRAWAGYLVTKSGDKYAFALLINHYNGTDKAIRNASARLLAALCAQ
ncbi:MAG: D-alanyl-D-alanine carboxypeptidase/D-alanyl-D-alanine endopeptidase [Roseibacillus sp.]